MYRHLTSSSRATIYWHTMECKLLFSPIHHQSNQPLSNYKHCSHILIGIAISNRAMRPVCPLSSSANFQKKIITLFWVQTGTVFFFQASKLRTNIYMQCSTIAHVSSIRIGPNSTSNLNALTELSIRKTERIFNLVCGASFASMVVLTKILSEFANLQVCVCAQSKWRNGQSVMCSNAKLSDNKFDDSSNNSEYLEPTSGLGWKISMILQCGCIGSRQSDDHHWSGRLLSVYWVARRHRLYVLTCAWRFASSNQQTVNVFQLATCLPSMSPYLGNDVISCLQVENLNCLTCTWTRIPPNLNWRRPTPK